MERKTECERSSTSYYIHTVLYKRLLVNTRKRSLTRSAAAAASERRAGARRQVPDAGMDRVRNGHGYDVCEVRADTYIRAG